MNSGWSFIFARRELVKSSLFVCFHTVESESPVKKNAWCVPRSTPRKTEAKNREHVGTSSHHTGEILARKHYFLKAPSILFIVDSVLFTWRHLVKKYVRLIFFVITTFTEVFPIICAFFYCFACRCLSRSFHNFPIENSSERGWLTLVFRRSKSMLNFSKAVILVTIIV